MKILSPQKCLYIIALILLIATNVFVLIGVIYNRSGEPEALVHLTERELEFPYSVQKENNGLSLILNWRALHRDENDAISISNSPDWLNKEKLTELGFDIDNYKNKNEHHKIPLPVEVFVVLENNGKAYQESLRRAEKLYAKANQEFMLSNNNEDLKKELDEVGRKLNEEKQSKSRLFVIDVGGDPLKLRMKYNHTGQYIIAKGVVGLKYRNNSVMDNKNDITGYISDLSIKKINVPLHQRKLFADLLSEKINRHESIDPPHYSIRIAYGNKYEPWIQSIDLL